MVRKIIKQGMEYFECEECGFLYKDEETAKKCEEWCAEHHSCNLDITKDALKLCR